MTKKFIVGVDIDEVCADLNTAWLGRYNKEYNDTLSREEITDWGVHLFTKQECGTAIYKYLADPTLYDAVKPKPHALDSVRELRKAGHRVVFITATVIGSHGEKFHWLNKHKFEPNEKDYVEIGDKSLIFADFLLDDRYENANNFREKGVLFNAPWNKKYIYPIRVNNWAGFLKIVKEDAA